MYSGLGNFNSLKLWILQKVPSPNSLFTTLFFIWQIIIFPSFPLTLVNSTRKIARFTKSSLTRNSVWCRQSMKPPETISTERQSTDLFLPIKTPTSLFHRSTALFTGTSPELRPNWTWKCVDRDQNWLHTGRSSARWWAPIYLLALSSWGGLVVQRQKLCNKSEKRLRSFVTMIIFAWKFQYTQKTNIRRKAYFISWFVSHLGYLVTMSPSQVDSSRECTE